MVIFVEEAVLQLDGDQSFRTDAPRSKTGRRHSGRLHPAGSRKGRQAGRQKLGGLRRLWSQQGLSTLPDPAWPGPSASTSLCHFLCHRPTPSSETLITQGRLRWAELSLAGLEAE